jgi:hypothetical protein
VIDVIGSTYDTYAAPSIKRRPRDAYLTFLILAIGLVAPKAQAAQPMPLDGTWVKLAGVDNTPVPYIFPGGPWILSLSESFRLTVTDWQFAGGLFEVYDNDILLGSTSSIPVSGAYAAEPDLALGNSRFSQNAWVLATGTHSITIKGTQLALTFANSSVAFKAERIPDGGATLLLPGMALSGIAGFRPNRTPRPGASPKI